MPNIVVSYRREDSKWIAGRVFDHLEAHYGKNNVFMDIDSIPFGLDFREHIQNTLSNCDILVAVIGPRWLEADEQGQARIREETDWVRIEIEAALNKKIPVIPVLIDRARMPKPTELPPSMQNFAFRQAADVDTGRDFRAHMDRLIRSMDGLLSPPTHRTPPAAPPQPSSKPASPPETPSPSTHSAATESLPAPVPSAAGEVETPASPPSTRQPTNAAANAPTPREAIVGFLKFAILSIAGVLAYVVIMSLTTRGR